MCYVSRSLGVALEILRQYLTELIQQGRNTCSRNQHKGFFLAFSFSTTIGWVALMFNTDVQGTQRMNPNDFGELLTFPLARPTVLSLIRWNTLRIYWMEESHDWFFDHLWNFSTTFDQITIQCSPEDDPMTFNLTLSSCSFWNLPILDEWT